MVAGGLGSAHYQEGFEGAFGFGVELVVASFTIKAVLPSGGGGVGGFGAADEDVVAVTGEDEVVAGACFYSVIATSKGGNAVVATAALDEVKLKQIKGARVALFQNNASLAPFEPDLSVSLNNGSQ